MLLCAATATTTGTLLLLPFLQVKHINQHHHHPSSSFFLLLPQTESVGVSLPSTLLVLSHHQRIHPPELSPNFVLHSTIGFSPFFAQLSPNP
jgi:hypothetical protein